MNNNPNPKAEASRRIIAIACGILFLLSLPLAAMQFTNEVQWTAFDFMAAAMLLLALGLSIELIARHIRTQTLKIAALAVLLLTFLFVWAELAVGIVGSPIGGH